MTRKLSKSSKGVKHHLPHRTRLKLPQEHRHNLHAVGESLKRVPGVKEVHINQRTGSVLVEHDEREGMLENFGEAIDEVAGDVFEAVLETAGVEIPGLSIVAHLIRAKLSKVDTDVAVATNNVVDIKMIVPMLFLGAGVIQARRSVSWWTGVPAWALFYCAFDTYMKFHGPSVREVSATERIEADGTLQNPKSRVRRIVSTGES